MEVAKVKQDIVTRRGQGAREIAKVAAGRKMLEVVSSCPATDRPVA